MPTPGESDRGAILLVEDDDEVREIVAEMLEATGYRIVSERDGESALKSFREGRFVCILIDLRLPDLDGREVLDRIRQKDPGACIVLMSGMPLPDRFRKTPRLRPNAVLQKPFGEDELLAKIEEAVGDAGLDRDHEVQ